MSKMPIKHRWLCALLLLACRVGAEQYQISVLGGISASREPQIGDDGAPTQQIDLAVGSGDSVAAIVNIESGMNSDNGRNYYEFLIARSRFDVDVRSRPADGPDAQYRVQLEALHVHLGGTYGWRAQSAFRPYFALTAGLSEYRGDNDLSDSFFSFSVGGGGKLLLTDTLALRFDARAFAVLLEDDTRIFCRNNVCSITVAGDLWLQPQVSLGVFLNF